jgi:hypothetical protein
LSAPVASKTTPSRMISGEPSSSMSWNRRAGPPQRAAVVDGVARRPVRACRQGGLPQQPPRRAALLERERRAVCAVGDDLRDGVAVEVSDRERRARDGPVEDHVAVEVGAAEVGLQRTVVARQDTDHAEVFGVVRRHGGRERGRDARRSGVGGLIEIHHHGCALHVDVAGERIVRWGDGELALDGRREQAGDRDEQAALVGPGHDRVPRLAQAGLLVAIRVEVAVVRVVARLLVHARAVGADLSRAAGHRALDRPAAHAPAALDEARACTAGSSVAARRRGRAPAACRGL